MAQNFQKNNERHQTTGTRISVSPKQDKQKESGEKKPRHISLANENQRKRENLESTQEKRNMAYREKKNYGRFLIEK